MAFADIDLTLGSIFASDVNPNLLLRPAWRYHSDHGASDGRNRIFGWENDNVRWMLNNVQIIYQQFEENKDLFYTHCISCHHNMFDENPKWARLRDPYSEMFFQNGNRQSCDKCGTDCTLLDSHYGLCDRCTEDETYIRSEDSSGLRTMTDADLNRRNRPIQVFDSTPNPIVMLLSTLTDPDTSWTDTTAEAA
jgi:hypothetical protein